MKGISWSQRTIYNPRVDPDSKYTARAQRRKQNRQNKTKTTLIPQPKGFNS